MLILRCLSVCVIFCLISAISQTTSKSKLLTSYGHERKKHKWLRYSRKVSINFAFGGVFIQVNVAQIVQRPPINLQVIR